MKVIRLTATILKILHFKWMYFYSQMVTHIKFAANGVQYSKDFNARGLPIIITTLTSRIIIGKRFEMNSGRYHNIIGRQQPCYFVVGKNATLLIGDNVGISSTAIICHDNIVIGNDVRIGGGTVIYDTDFHSLILSDRISKPENIEHIKMGKVLIEDGVFIGAHCIILKGVTIGKNAIIGAGSLVAKSIPANEIWAGNPAKFVKKLPSA